MLRLWNKVSPENVEEKIILMSVFITDPVLRVSIKDTSQFSEGFLSNSINANDCYNKVEFVKVKEILKLAENCNAKLLKFYIGESKVKFAFSFSIWQDGNLFFKGLKNINE